MNKLQSELHRLFGPQDRTAEGGVRAVVLSLARPADWKALSAVWRGVQADLALPAPAIAVNGLDGFQLWFSLSETVSASQALGFVSALRASYLGDIASQRVALTTGANALPPLPTLPGQWSAFVAADLAPVFADEPWLDVPPSPEAQGDVLGRLESIKTVDFQLALDRLGATTKLSSESASTSTALKTPSAEQDPASFLRQIMNDGSVALGLRIEAAKALLAAQGRHRLD